MTATEKGRNTLEGALDQVADELRLQAWLAEAERREPSAHLRELVAEARPLATLRDELRVQGHLAGAEAAAELAGLEERWRRLTQLADRVVGEAASEGRALLAEIRAGYEGIRRRQGV